MFYWCILLLGSYCIQIIRVPFSLAFYGEIVLFARVFIGIKLIFYMLVYYTQLVCYFSIGIRFNNTRISVFNSGSIEVTPAIIGVCGILGSNNFIVSFILYILFIIPILTVFDLFY